MRSEAIRRHRAASAGVVLVALVTIAIIHTLVIGPSPAQAAGDLVDEGSKIFTANCATCHGMQAEGTPAGPSLIGVGAAAVDFQVGTGRMPMQATSVQAPAKPARMTQEQTTALAAYVASLAPGPAIPSQEQVDASQGDAALGMALFRTNCAMCHGAAGAGGALTQGKYAPSLLGTSPTHIYEAMLTGPQSMPVFNDANLSAEDKRDIIAYVEHLREGSPGGLTLGGLGPVTEGLWAWVLGIGAMIAIAVWLGARKHHA